MTAAERHPETARGPALISEVLILPDGRVLGHSLTPAFTRVLSALNPNDQRLRRRRDAFSESARDAPPPLLP